MDSLINDNFFQNMCGTCPANKTEHEETAIEPRREKVAEVEVECSKLRFLRGETQKLSPETYQLAGRAGDPIESAN